MTERTKNFIAGAIAGAIITGAIVGGSAATMANSGKKAIALNTAREEATCQDFGRHMGYDVDYSESGTCFVVMEHGITVPLEEALAIQQLVFASRQQIADFNRPRTPAK